MHTQEKQRVIKAISELGRKVSVADVATKTGLPLLVVASELNKVAAETRGHLQVSTAGDIAYRFDFGFQNAYLARGVRRFLQNCWEQTFRVGFFLLRISFGIMLIISLLIIVLLFFLIVLSLSRGGDSDDDRGFGFNSFNFFDYLILRELFFWDPYTAYRSNQRYGRSTRSPAKKGNFLYNCFSFLFGDGNPNPGLEEERWQLIPQVIRKNGYVVSAEQLAPYTDADPKNEDGVLPVLVRFDGRPEVTDSGNIVYVFPSLKVSAAEHQESATPAYLREWPWKFSNLSADQLMPVGLLAALNLLGSWWLYAETSKMPFLISLTSLLAALAVYGSLFVLVPLGRWLTIKFLNAGIDARNSRRQQLSSLLEKPDDDLRKKLAEAEQFQTKLEQISSTDVAYTTDKDLLEQQFDSAAHGSPEEVKPSSQAPADPSKSA
jgi:hypothetical protein